LSTVPTILDDVDAIYQAFVLANQANLSREELEELEHQVMFIQDQRGAITKATKQAQQEGRQEGWQEAQLEIARRLLPVLDDATIATTTGLPVSEIQRLRESSS
jgi:predicted transposase/invertase (TIGR01784 family)